MSNEQSKKHYFLIAANVMYANKAQTMAAAMPVNVMIVSDRREFNQSMLARATQNSQIQFMKSLPEEAQSDLVVAGVQLQNIVHLGEMTEAEFAAVPDGYGIVEA